MSIKFWTSRHRATLYNIFDKVRLYNFAVIDAIFMRDMLDQKITQKAYRRIENEWLTYLEDIYDEMPDKEENLIICSINENQYLLFMAGKADEICKTIQTRIEEISDIKTKREKEED